MNLFFREFSSYFLPFVLAINYSIYFNFSDLRKLVNICAIVATFFGVVEYFTQINILIDFLPKSTADAEYLNMLEYDQSRDGGYRARSVYVHSLIYAEFIAIYSIFLLSYIENRLRDRIFFLATLFLVSVVISASFTGTRSSFVGVIAGLVAYKLAVNFLSSRGDRLFKAMKLVLALVAILFAYQIFSEYIIDILSGRTQEEVSSSMARELMYELGVNGIIERPIFGYGLGQFEFAAIEGLGGKLTLDSHVLSLTIESGVVGLLLFFAQFLAALIYGFKFGNKEMIPVYMGVFVVCVIYSPVLFMTYAYIILYAIIPFLFKSDGRHEN